MVCSIRLDSLNAGMMTAIEGPSGRTVMSTHAI